MQPDGVRLLCVDDDQHLVDLLRYAFEREGFAVQTAHTARDAMHLLRASFNGKPPAGSFPRFAAHVARPLTIFSTPLHATRQFRGPALKQ